MATPTWLIQMDVSGTAFGGSPTWTDVTTFVLDAGQPVSVTWGRQDEVSDPQPATCTIVFDNTDGRFTPDAATLTTGGANPYYPNVDLTTRLRVSVTVSGVTFARFDGYITDITLSYPSGGSDCIATVTASDISNRLSNDQPLGTMLQETIQVDGPLVYLPLTDAAGSTAPNALVNSGGSGIPTIITSKYGGGAVTFAGGAGPVAEATQAVSIVQPGGQQGSVINIPLNVTWNTASHQSLHLRVNWTGTNTSGYLATAGNGAGGGVTLGLDGSGHLQAVVNSLVTLTSSATVNDGKPHDLAVSITYQVPTSNYAITLYIDGVAAASIAATPLSAALTYMQVAGQLTASAQNNFTSGTFSHAALYIASTTPNWADHYNAGKTGFAGETTTAHYTRLLSFRPNTGTNLDTGKGTVGLHPVSDVTLWQALLETSHAEGGVVYVDGQGRVTTHNRATLYDPTPALTLNVASQQIERDITFKRDSQTVTNDVQVTRPNGSSQRIVNPRLKTKHGQRVYSGTINVNSDSDLRDAAGWMIALLGTPRTKAPTVRVRLDLETSTAQAQAVLAASVWTVLQITTLPATAPATSVSLLVEGGSETLGVDEWSVTFITAALPPKTLRADATPSTNTKLDAGLVIPW